MATITKLIVHNSGGLGNNPIASTQHLTVADIDAAHRLRWPEFKSELGYWVGYTFVILKEGTLIQTRLVGAEGAHTKGSNMDSVGVLLMGNFTKGVDTPTYAQKMRLKSLANALINWNEQLSYGYIKVKPDTVLAITDVGPHRKYTPAGYTECYGNALSDIWLRELLGEDVPDIQKLILTLKIKLYELMVKLLKQQNGLSGAVGGCVCERG